MNLEQLAYNLQLDVFPTLISWPTNISSPQADVNFELYHWWVSLRMFQLQDV